MNHFLDLVYDSFICYFTLSVGSWVICCTQPLVDVEGFAKSLHALLVNLASWSDTISCGKPQSGYT